MLMFYKSCLSVFFDVIEVAHDAFFFFWVMPDFIVLLSVISFGRMRGKVLFLLLI